MIEEITAGPAASIASHCASKSGGSTSPAAAGTGGPHWPRNSRTLVSASASRRGGGSGIQVLSWTAPLLEARNSRAQSAMPAGGVSTAPNAPMPPALATADARLAGQAPAIGAIRIGSLRPKRWQKALARSRGEAVMGRLRAGLRRADRRPNLGPAARPMIKPESILCPRPEGLYCAPGDFFVDPVRPVERA